MEIISFFSTSKKGSRTIAPKENIPPILALTLKLTQTLTPTWKWQLSLRGIVWTPVKTKETKNQKKKKKKQ